MLQKIWQYLIPIAAALLTGGLAALLTQEDIAIYAAMDKPPLSPPAPVFPIAWTILYVLMGVSAGLVRGEPGGEKAQGVYYLQLVFNFLWPILFFSFRLYWAAVVDLLILLGLVIYMTVKYWRIRPLAGYLLLPYVAWLFFALYLNIGAAVLNG